MQAIQMVDLHRQYERLKTEIDTAIANVISHTKFINGPESNDFANELAQYLDVKHVIPCANGTDALQVALMALDLKKDDEIITPSFTFVATVEVIALLRLKPVLVDVDAKTFCIDPNLIEKALTPRTKAIIPVHLFGQGADMERINNIAKKNNLIVIEDAAQCIGASYTLKNGTTKKLGTMGDIGCTSFFPSKNLGCFGDGGACFTNNDQLAHNLKRLVNHGSSKKYYNDIIGVNSRLDTLQAAILRAKLPHLDDFNHRRQQVALSYDKLLTDIAQIKIPVRNIQSDHVFHQYTLTVMDGKRDELSSYLQNHSIPSMVYYPVPIHAQEAFKHFVENPHGFAIADRLSNEVLSLPIHTEMDNDQIEYICATIRQFFS